MAGMMYPTIRDEYMRLWRESLLNRAGHASALPPETFNFVSRLLAATPPYFYDADLTRGGTFFSDMLRNLVAKRRREEAAESEKQQQQHAQAVQEHQQQLLAQKRPAPSEADREHVAAPPVSKKPKAMDVSNLVGKPDRESPGSSSVVKPVPMASLGPPLGQLFPPMNHNLLYFPGIGHRPLPEDGTEKPSPQLSPSLEARSSSPHGTEEDTTRAGETSSSSDQECPRTKEDVTKEASAFRCYRGAEDRSRSPQNQNRNGPAEGGNESNDMALSNIMKNLKKIYQEVGNKKGNTPPPAPPMSP
ncbi:unnamed protein product [Cyprideis torosa]|uniref:Uncharacterized protein n=1 Tax=Cyprideis torosa TaxID=163714 RepID=A0A7R8W1K4_9CRUS|nr:unnamed protein product [Cyprideis torosa]CAG0881013.1 unnamed protein product [Cyprideis torosa]